MVRFAATHLTGEILAHELVHTALVVYRLNGVVDVRPAGGCGRREEQLACIYGELYADLQRHLHH